MEEKSYDLNKPKFSSPEEELAYLRAKVLEHEQKLGTTNTADREKIIRQELATHKEHEPEQALGDRALSSAQQGAIVLDLEPRTTDKQVEELLGLMEVKGLLNTLLVVERANNPRLEDDFHRVLVQYVKLNLPVKGLQEKSPLFLGLNMTLFEIALRPSGKDENERPLKELLSAMEQLLLNVSGTLSSGGEKKSISFEIAVSNENRDVVIYSAVPTSQASLFEKQVLALFPKARIKEEKNDYNIFKEHGVVSASYATFTKQGALPIKRYTEFDTDPLAPILNAFSKIAEVGEGASLQFVISPPPVDYIYKYKEAISKIEKGVSVKEALDIKESMAGDLAKDAKGAIKDLFFGSKSDKQKEKDREKASSDESQTTKEAVKRKIETPIVSTGIRAVVSADSKDRADAILSEIESAFNQFEDTFGNKIQFKKYQQKDLPNLFRDFSFRVFEKDESMPVSLRELATLFHFPTKNSSEISELREAKFQTAPAPINISKEGIFLGVNSHRGQRVDIRFAPEDRLRHFYVIGQTGTGKSTLLKNMVVQDIQNGDGVCFIDPHGNDIQEILGSVPPNRFNDVIYFDPGYTKRPMGLNMLEFDERFPEQRTFIVNELISIFNKLFDMKVAGGPAFEQYFRNSAMLVMEHPQSGNTLLEIGRVLGDKAFRDMKMMHCKNPIIKQFWMNAEKTSGDQSLANFVPYITSKFDPFLSNDIMRPVVAQEKSAFNFRELMDNKKILLVNLSKGRLGELNSSLIGLILVGKILMAALSRADSFGKVLPPFYLYIDEFQNVTTDSISSILSEARKYKLSLTIAHQFIAQLEDGIRDSVFGNVGSISTFRVGSEDAEFLEKQFSPVFTSTDIMNIDNRNAYVKLLVNGKIERPFNVEMSPPPKWSEEVADSLKELSYIKYGKDRFEVEEKIMDRYKPREV